MEVIHAVTRRRTTPIACGGDSIGAVGCCEPRERRSEHGRGETKKNLVSRGHGYDCFKSRASRAINLGQVHKHGKLQPTGAKLS